MNAAVLGIGAWLIRFRVVHLSLGLIPGSVFTHKSRRESFLAAMREMNQRRHEQPVMTW
jgi:hypothetical protein